MYASTQEQTDHYAVLGVHPAADITTIRRAFRERATQCHPDRGGNHRAMLRLNAAWEVLSDPEKRRHYDVTRQPRASAEAKAQFADDLAAAQAKAADYPRDWSHFEAWLNEFADDFSSARSAYASWWEASVSHRIVSLAPVLAGAMLGALGAWMIGALLGADPLIGAAIGAVSGGAAGMFAKPAS